MDAVSGHDRSQPCGNKAGRKYGRTTNTVVVNRPNGPECGDDATLTLGVVATVFPVMAARGDHLEQWLLDHGSFWW